MKQLSTDQQTFEVTAGLDLGDKYSHLCLIETATGEILEEARLRTDPETLKWRFSEMEPMRIAIETGTHSPWVSRLLEDAGHEVLVANARELGFIYKNSRKNDKLDAENLARVARLDPKLLSPIEHRDEEAQADLAFLRTRDVLVKSRTQFINHLRGVVKAFGARLPVCSTESFHPVKLDERQASSRGTTRGAQTGLDAHYRYYCLANRPDQGLRQTDWATRHREVP